MRAEEVEKHENGRDKYRRGCTDKKDSTALIISKERIDTRRLAITVNNDAKSYKIIETLHTVADTIVTWTGKEWGGRTCAKDFFP